MSFGAIRNGYEGQQYSYTKQAAAMAGDFSGEKTFVLPENAGNGEFLGIGFLDVGGGISYGMSAAYADHSTVDNPVILVKVRKENNIVESYEVNINEVDAGNATDIEMFALCNYADDIGKGTGSTFGSWQTLKNFGYNAERLGEFQLSGNLKDFLSSKQNWFKMVSDMTSVYMKAGIYKQVMDGNKLMGMFAHGRASQQESLLREEYRKLISEKKEEIYEKVMNNDTEASVQIGAQSFTEKEWNKLLEDIDKVEEEVRKLMEEKQEKEEDAIRNGDNGAGLPA